MAFIKQKELVGKSFGIEFKDSKKHVALWDDQEKKVVKLDENITLKSGDVIVFEEFTKLSDEDKKRYRHMINYNRKLNVVGEDDVYCGFSKTVEDQIVSLITNFAGMNIELNTLNFVLEETGIKLNPYKVSITKKEETSKNETISIPSVTEEEDVLSEKEKKIVDAYVETIKEKGYDTKDEKVKAAYVGGMVENGIERGRAVELYDGHITK